MDKKSLAWKARNCFHNQRRRCYTKTNPRYKDNGAKGITVDYTLKEFTEWFIENYKEFPGQKSSVGRIDHSKGYSLSNIRFESLAENSMERINRCGTTKPRKRVLIRCELVGEDVFIAESGHDAAKLTGIQSAHVSKYCSGEIKKSAKGFSLKYAENIDMDKIQSL
jgi:hypothetical protein